MVSIDAMAIPVAVLAYWQGGQVSVPIFLVTSIEKCIVSFKNNFDHTFLEKIFYFYHLLHCYGKYYHYFDKIFDNNVLQVEKMLVT